MPSLVQVVQVWVSHWTRPQFQVRVGHMISRRNSGWAWYAWASTTIAKHKITNMTYMPNEHKHLAIFWETKNTSKLLNAHQKVIIQCAMMIQNTSLTHLLCLVRYTFTSIFYFWHSGQQTRVEAFMINLLPGKYYCQIK